jgi:hypothetical protein
VVINPIFTADCAPAGAAAVLIARNAKADNLNALFSIARSFSHDISLGSLGGENRVGILEKTRGILHFSAAFRHAELAAS